MSSIFCPGENQAPATMCPGENQGPVILCPSSVPVTLPATTCNQSNSWTLASTGSDGLRGVDIVRDPGTYNVAVCSDDTIRYFNPVAEQVIKVIYGVDKAGAPVQHRGLVSDRTGSTWDLYTLSRLETHHDGSGLVRVYGGETGNLLYRIGGKNVTVGQTVPAGNWLPNNLVRDNGKANGRGWIWCTAYSALATGDPAKRHSLWGMDPGGNYSFPGGLVDPISTPEMYSLIPDTPTQLSDGPYSIFGDSLGDVWVALANGKVYHFYPGGAGTWTLVNDFGGVHPRWFGEGPDGFIYGFRATGGVWKFSKRVPAGGAPALVGTVSHTGSFGFNQNPMMTDTCGYMWTGDGRFNVYDLTMSFETGLSLNAEARLDSQNTIQHPVTGKVYSTGSNGQPWLLTEADCTCF